jgi:prepilin-type N-terminal cleavage/methylation domain-containing protein
MDKPIDFQGNMFPRKSERPKGFTLIELLVVLACISLLMAIAAPTLGEVRRKAKTLIGVSNQRQIVLAVNLYALDNDGRYPESMATITFSSDNWGWQEPTMMTACHPRPSLAHRSISAYLRSYTADASIMFSPSAPTKCEYLQQAWDDGDDWNNPETGYSSDPLYGTYCFYWNYVAVVPDRRRPFEGPRSCATGRRKSKLLVSDYFGFGHWRNGDVYGSREAYGSCERFRAARVTPGTPVSTDFWSRLKSDANVDLHTLKIKLHAGYVDGHVECYSPAEVVPIKVSFAADGSVPYPSTYRTNPGIFYIPRRGLR